MRKKIEALIEELYNRAVCEGIDIDRYRRKGEERKTSAFIGPKCFHEGKALAYGQAADKLKALLEECPPKKYPCIKLPSA